MNVKLGGVNAGDPDFDQLHVAGAVTLAGTLNVTTINGFLLQQGETFAIMTYASLSGDFGVKNVPMSSGNAVLTSQANAGNYALVSNLRTLTWTGP